jgi:hypothetical protein
VTRSGVGARHRRAVGFGVAGPRWCLLVGASVALGLGPGLALGVGGWSDEAKIQVKVHDHVFYTAKASADGCTVSVRLQFEAPPSAYSDPAPERNHYRFSAKISFSEGQSFVSERPLDNRAAGARMIAFTQDTTGRGCWAERQHTLRKVDVHACRGAGCVPMPFE